MMPLASPVATCARVPKHAAPPPPHQPTPCRHPSPACAHQTPQVTGFTNDEEYAVAKEKVVPFLLQDRLTSLGGLFESSKAPWAPHAVLDPRAPFPLVSARPA